MIRLGPKSCKAISEPLETLFFSGVVSVGLVSVYLGSAFICSNKMKVADYINVLNDQVI